MTVLSNDPAHASIVLGIDAVIRHQLVAEPAQAYPFAQRRGPCRGKESYWRDAGFFAALEAICLDRGQQLVGRRDVPPRAAGAQGVGTAGSRERLPRANRVAGGNARRTFCRRGGPLGQAAGPGGPSRILQLPIAGRIDGRMSIFGPSIDSNQVLRLGVLRRGAAAREEVAVESQRCAAAVHLASHRERARVSARAAGPYQEGSAKKGLYRLDVEVPGDAPCCNYSGANRGQIRLLTDHPHLPSIELKVRFLRNQRRGPVGGGGRSLRAISRLGALRLFEPGGSLKSGCNSTAFW